MTPAGPQRLSRKAALVSSLGLSLLFLLVYGACNAWTAHRARVGTIHAEWERGLPFLPAFIVPYMSIDLFFVAAPLLCRRFEELRAHAARIAFATLFAGAAFLLFPLRFAFERPPVSGFFGALFGLLGSFDKPHNLFPSLHLAYLAILWALYRRRTRGVPRVAVLVWFLLTGASPLFTYQHHLADVAGGLGLGLLCLYAFPDAEGEPASRANGRVFGAYALGAGACLVFALLLGGWARLLLWPAASLGLLAGAYAGVGPGIFRKRDGRTPLLARAIFGPYRFGAWVCRRFLRAKALPWTEVADGVLLGPALDAREAAGAIRSGVTAVLDVTAELSESEPFLGLPYGCVPMLDLAVPRRSALARAVQFLGREEGRGKVYVHCALGYSRSALCVAAWMLSTGRARTVEQAVGLLRDRRPGVKIGEAGRSVLREFERRGDSPTGEEAATAAGSAMEGVRCSPARDGACGRTLS